MAIWYVVAAVGGAAVGAILGFVIRKATAEKKIGSAEEQAKHILEEAIKNAETTKKEAIFAAKIPVGEAARGSAFTYKIALSNLYKKANQFCRGGFYGYCHPHQQAFDKCRAFQS